MKIESSYHSKSERSKECKKDLNTKSFLKEEKYHPLLQEREYVRALNSTKIDKFLSKPFIKAFNYHKEGINLLNKDFNRDVFISSSYDNEVILFNIKKDIFYKKSFENIVRGIALQNERVYVSQNNKVFTFSDDFKKSINFYETENLINNFDIYNKNLSISTNYNINIFDLERESPINTFSLKSNTNKINKTFPYILGSITESNIKLLDTRANEEVLSINSENNNLISCLDLYENKVAYNLNENAVLFDIRNQKAKTFRKHVNDIVSLSFHPGKQEFITGSNDCTIHINNGNDDVYYNQRMGSVYGLQYSNDGMFIISGSDDGALRLWKGFSNDKLKIFNKQEKEALTYRNSLKNKFKFIKEIKRIEKHKFLPKEIKIKKKQKFEQYQAKIRKEKKNLN